MKPVWESEFDKLKPLHVALDEIAEVSADDRERTRHEVDQPEGPAEPERPVDEQDTAIDHPEEAYYEDPQQVVVQAPIDRNVLVLAPPGTGKTHVLVSRLVHLLNSGAFSNPSEEILVLSFTRATVAEIRRRVAEHAEQGAGDNLRYVGVRTFDSFATHVLLEELGEDGMQEQLWKYEGSSFDRRIRLFTDLLIHGNNGEMAEAVSRVRYLVVDEIQDLVCARAAMVVAMIKQVLGNDGSVLLFGDPAQAIYDYQSRNLSGECVERITSHDFLEKVRYTAESRLEEIPFRHFFRYSDPVVRDFVEKARRAMGTDGAHPDHAELLRLMYELGGAEELSRLPARAQKDGGVAVLVRRNVEAHQLYGWCRKNDLPVHLHRGARGGVWPAVLARVFGGWKQDVMTLDRFQTRWGERVPGGLDDERKDLEQMLQERAVLTDGVFDLQRLRYIVSTEPAPLAPLPSAGIIVSNIHRSKGLEYDSVMVLEPDVRGALGTEEIRVLYVAATRARKRLGVLGRNAKVFRSAREVGKTGYYRVGDVLHLTGLEDLDSDLLASGLTSPSGIESIQEELWRTFGIYNADRHEAYLCLRENGGRIDLSLAINMPSGKLEDICWCDQSLSQAAYGSRYKARILADSIEGWPVRVTGLATTGYLPENDEATDQFGNAGLALIPVLDSTVNLK